MDGYKNANKNAIVRVIIGIVAVVLSVVALFVSHSAFKGQSNLPFLRALGVALVTLSLIIGVAYAIYTVVFRRKVFALISSLCIWFGITLLLAVCLIKWWVVVIISLALLTVLTLCLMGVYSKQLVVVPDNASPDYKDYKTRTEEKLAAEKNKPEEELPEIKSFK